MPAWGSLKINQIKNLKNNKLFEKKPPSLIEYKIEIKVDYFENMPSWGNLGKL